LSAVSPLGGAGKIAALRVRLGGSSVTIIAATAIEDRGGPSVAEREAPVEVVAPRLRADTCSR
jgi:hypothetical protein